LNTKVSQGSVVPHLRHGEDFNHPLVANLLLSDGERIGQHLAKL